MKDADVQDVSEKSVNAVVEVTPTPVFTRVFHAVVYPLPLATSLEAL